MSEEFVAISAGDNLILKFADGTVVTLVNFYAVKAELEVGEDATIAAQEAPPIETATDEVIVYKSNDTDDLGAFFQSIVSSASNSAWGLMGAIAAASQLNSSSDASQADTPNTDSGDTPADPVDTTALVMGSVVAGPVTENNDLYVLAYSAETVELLTLDPAKVLADGSFDLSFEDFEGPVVFVLVSESDAVPDYLDEAMGSEINLNDALSSVADIKIGENNVTVSPLTTLTALRLGAELISLTMDDVNLVISNEDGISVEEIAQAFVEVSQALGVDPVELASSATAIIETDENGQVVMSDNASSNTYGILLAALSGLDAIDGVGLTEGLKTLADSIVVNQDGTTSLSNEGQSTLLRGVAAANAVTSVNVQQVAQIIDPEAATQAASTQINSAADLNAMSPAAAAFVTSEQLQTLSTVADLNPAVLGLIAPEIFASLPITSYADLTPEQLATLPSSHYTSLQQNGVELTADVVQNLAPDAMKVVSAEVIATLSVEQLQALSPSQVAGLNAEQFGALPVESLQALEPVQLATVSPRVIATLSLEQFEALSQEQSQVLGANGGLNRLPVELVTSIDASTISVVPPVVFQGMSDEDIATLSADQLSSLTTQQLSALGVSGLRPELQEMIQTALTDGLAGNGVSTLAELQELLDQTVLLKDSAVEALLSFDASNELTAEDMAALGYDGLDAELVMAKEILLDRQPTTEDELFDILNAAESLMRFLSDGEAITIADLRTLGITAPRPRYYVELAEALSDEYTAGNIENFSDVQAIAEQYIAQSIAVNEVLTATSASDITPEILDVLGLSDAQDNSTFAAYFLDSLAPTTASEIDEIIEALNAVFDAINGQGSLTAEQLAVLGLASATDAEIALIETYLAENGSTLTAEVFAPVLADPGRLDTSNGGDTGGDAGGSTGETRGTSGGTTDPTDYGPYTTKDAYIASLETFYSGLSGSMMNNSPLPFNFGKMLTALSDMDAVALFTTDYVNAPSLYQSVIERALFGDMGPIPLTDLLPIDEAFVLDKISELNEVAELGLAVVANYLSTGEFQYNDPNGSWNFPTNVEYFLYNFAPAGVSVYQGFMLGVGADYVTPIANGTYATAGEPTLEELQALISSISQTFVDEQIAAIQEDLDGNVDGIPFSMDNVGLLTQSIYSSNPPVGTFYPDTTRASLLSALSGTVTIESLEAAIDAFHDANRAEIIAQIASGDPSQFDINHARPYYWISQYSGPVIEALFDPTNYADPSAPTSIEISNISRTISREIDNTLYSLFEYANGMTAPSADQLASIFGQAFVDDHYQDLLDAIDASASVISRYFGNTTYISMLVEGITNGQLTTPFDPWGYGGSGGGGGGSTNDPLADLLDRIAEDMAGNADGMAVSYYDLTNYFDNLYDICDLDSQTKYIEAITDASHYVDAAAPTEAEVQVAIDLVVEDLRELVLVDFRSWLTGDSSDTGFIYKMQSLFGDNFDGAYITTYLNILEAQKDSLFADLANVTSTDVTTVFGQLTIALDNLVAEVIEDYNGNANGSLITLEAIQAVLPHITADRLSMFHDHFADQETWNDPRGPLEGSEYEILNRLDVVDQRIMFLDELAEDLAGNTNTRLASADYSGVFNWLPSELYNRSNYSYVQGYQSEMLVASNYADQSNPTWDEFVAVLERVNEQQDFITNFVATLQGSSTEPVTVAELRMRFDNLLDGQDAIYENLLQTSYSLGEYRSDGGLNTSMNINWQTWDLTADAIQTNINQATGYFAVQQLFLAARNGDTITLDMIRLAGLRNYSQELLDLPAEYEADYLAVLADEANYSYGYVNIQQLNDLVASTNRDIAVSELVEDIAGDTNGTAFNIDWLLSTEPSFLANSQAYIMAKDDALNYPDLFNTALLNGTYVDPANPTDAEISAIVQTTAEEARVLQALADLALDIEGSQSTAQLDEREVMALIGLIDDNLYDVYYRELTDASNYADPTNPTKAEVEAVSQAVKTASDTSFAQMSLITSGQADASSMTLEMLTSISDKIVAENYDYYLDTLFAKNNFLWEYQPTTEEIKNAIDLVNNIIAPTAEAGMVSLATDLFNGATSSNATVTERHLAAITVEIIPRNSINPYYYIDDRFMTKYLDAVLDPANYADSSAPTASEVKQIVQNINRTDGLALMGEVYTNTGSYADVNTDSKDFNVYYGMLGYEPSLYQAFNSGQWVHEVDAMRVKIEDPASYADPANPTWEEFQAAAAVGQKEYWTARLATFSDYFRFDIEREEKYTDLQILEALDKAGFTVADQDWEAVEWLLRNGGASFETGSVEAAVTLPKRLRALSNGLDDDGQGLTSMDFQNIARFDKMLQAEYFNFTSSHTIFDKINTQAEVDLMNDILDAQTYSEASAVDASAEFYNGSGFDSSYTYSASYAGIRDNVLIVDQIMQYAVLDAPSNGAQYLPSSELAGLGVLPTIYDPVEYIYDGYKIAELIIDSANDGSEVNTLSGLEKVLSRQTYMTVTSDNVPDMSLYPEGTDVSRVDTVAYDETVSFTVRFAEDVTDFDLSDIEFTEHTWTNGAQVTTNYDFAEVDARTYTITYNQSVALGDEDLHISVKILEDAVTLQNGQTNLEQSVGQSIDPTAPILATAIHNSWGRAFYKYAPGAGMVMQNESSSYQTTIELNFSRGELTDAANGTEYIQIDVSDAGMYAGQSVIIENVATSVQTPADLIADAGVTYDLYIQVPSELAVGQYRVIVPDAVFENTVGLTNSGVDDPDLYVFNITA